MPKHQEIERKFLVHGDFKKNAVDQIDIIQGFLSRVPERTIRIRISGNRASLTIKGIGNDKGTTRFEWEKEISITEAKILLPLCEKHFIEKTRYIIPIEKDLFFEVDVFKGTNKGLVIAEIELPDENKTFEKPEWIGKEITGDYRYYNSSLSEKPFREW